MSPQTKSEFMKWLKTALIGGAGGGIAGSVAALSDPAKYSFPKDLGTGKMWPFFLSGAAMTIGAMLIKSPFGQKAMTAYKDSQAQLTESQAAIEQAKADFKASTPPASQPSAAELSAPPTAPPQPTPKSPKK